MLLLAMGMLALLVLAMGPVQAQGPDGGTPQAIGTAFTYQGQLEKDGNLVNDTCNLEFRLYTAASGGSQVGPTQSRSGVVVTDGLFTIPDLSFGIGAFAGDSRWLEVAVQCTGDPAFATLSPRQEMTPAPYALYASSVGPHEHWGETWSGSGTGLTLSGGDTGLSGSGSIYGLYGESAAAGGRGVRGYASAATGATFGVSGTADSNSGTGVYGVAGASSGTTYGVYGRADSPDGTGVYGVAGAPSGTTYGVYGQVGSSSGTGVYGWATHTQGTSYGVAGRSDGYRGVGVYGYASALFGLNDGVYGETASSFGIGVHGESSASTGGTGVFGQARMYGVYGRADGTYQPYGVYGQSTSTVGHGMHGEATTTTGATYGVYGEAKSNTGVGVYGYASSTLGGSGLYAHNKGPGSAGSALWAQAENASGIAIWGRNTSNDATLVLENYGSGDLIRAFISGGELRFRVTNDGDVRSDAGFHTPAADMAEMLPAAAGLEPGDVLVIGADGKLARSSEPYQPTVVGVYSTRPGFVGGSGIGGDSNDRVPLAVVGVVPVKASAENGPIRPGDLLVASATPGHAMRAGPNPPIGTVIGKALAGLERGTGIIQMLVVLQ